MCNPFIPLSCPGVIAGAGQAIAGGVTDTVANSMVDTLMSGLAGSVTGAIEWVTGLLASWILIPSNELCNTNGSNVASWAGDWVQQCNATAGPAQQLRRLMLPITVLLLVGGLIWQGVMIVITRKGEPLLQAVKGIWNTALWGAIGVAATHLVLKAGDSYSMWLLERSVFDDAEQPPNEAMNVALQGLMLPAKGVAPFAMVVAGMIVLLAALVQILLMIFREGAVVILAGLLQLAAAGTATRGGSPMLQKTLSWSLALACYKPAAASVYATAFLMMRGNGRDWLVGLGMFALSIVALPALMKFFTSFIGHASSAGGGLGMAGAGAAAGLHAASSLRGAAGGNTAGEHARYMDSQGPGAPGNTPSGARCDPIVRSPRRGCYPTGRTHSQRKRRRRGWRSSRWW